MRAFLSLLLLSTLFYGTACNDFDNSAEAGSETEADYLIFGQFYGFCAGPECVTLYRLDSGTISESADREVQDDYADVLNPPYNGDFEPRSQRLFDVAKDLQTTIPTALFDVKESVLGIPDAYDQGGIYLEMSRDGVVYTWRLDNDLESIPAFLRDYATDIKRVMVELRRESEVPD